MAATRKRWPSEQAFYVERPARRLSQSDCGVLWREPGDPCPWRITAFEDTREVIAVRGDTGEVELLATNVDWELVDEVLEHLPRDPAEADLALAGGSRSLPDARRALGGLARVDAATLRQFQAAAAAYREAEAEHYRQLEAAEFVCCKPTELPDPGFGPADVRHMLHLADWPAVGAAAADVLAAGIDPLDWVAVDRELAKRLDAAASKWALSLFRDPIHINTENRYVNGRHRGFCLRYTSSPAAVITSYAARAQVKKRCPPPPRPRMSWL